MQGGATDAPDCSKQASLAEVGQFRTKRILFYVAAGELVTHDIGRVISGYSENGPRRLGQGARYFW
jgi:hypothetical protein